METRLIRWCWAKPKAGWVLVSLLVAACGGSSTPSSSTIELGEVMNLTGPSGIYGVAIDAGVQFAIAEINGKGGVSGKQLHITVQDEASDNGQTVNVTRQMTSNKQIVAVIGPVYTANFVAGQPVANSAGVVWLSGGSGTPVDAQGTVIPLGHQPNAAPFTFQLMSGYDTLVVGFVVKEIGALNAKRVASIYLTDNPAQTFDEAEIKAAMNKLGMPLVADLGASAGALDYGPQITQLLQANPDVVLISMTEQDAATFMKQARQRGLKSQWIAPGNTLAYPRLFAESGGAADGMLISVDSDPTSSAVTQFVANFQQKNGKAPDSLSTYGYDDIYLLKAGIEKAASPLNGTSLRDALKSLGSFNAPLHGPTEYDGSGDFFLTTVVVEQLTSTGFKVISS